MHMHSTPNSIENGEASALAILETVLAVAAYWWFAWYFDTHTHLLVSIAVAPFLLLRSPQSVDLGVKWFRAYYAERSEITRTESPWRFWGINIASFGCGFAVAVALSSIMLSGHSGWSLFGFAMLVGLAALLWGIALAVALAGAGAVALAVALAGVGAVAVFFIPFTGGIWMRSLGIRLTATLFYLWSGLRHLQQNWRQALLVIDVCHPPDLVPGLNPKDALHFQALTNKLRNKIDPLMRLILVFYILIFFLPALFYRWSLKSTCWFYLPLIYLVWPRAKPGKTEVSLWHHSTAESFSRIIAVSTLVFAMIGSFDLLSHLDSFPLAQIIVYLYFFDLNRFAIWQLCGLFTAIMTGLIWYYRDHAARPTDLDHAAPPCPFYTALLDWFARLRSLGTIFFLVLAAGYVVLKLGKIDPKTLPAFLHFLTLLYGRYL
ncbi:MAG: hypothetical protein WCK65_10475 [Rhodospirillaceae bacterium]